MKTIHSAGFTLAALLLAASCGCSSAPTIARGQTPVSDPAVMPAGHGGPAATGGPHGYHSPPLQAMANQFRNTDVSHYEVDENGQVVPYSPHGQMQAAYAAHAQNCPTCRPQENCPRCQGHPPQGQTCPVCQNGAGAGNGNNDPNGFNHDYPQHHMTYKYLRPNNLRYPPPQVPGGAVVYPYYTHKSPSDFFRDD